MSYGLRGCDGRVHGLGVFNPPAPPTFIDPGYPPDPAIVAQNTLNNNRYQVAIAGAQTQNNLDQCRANAQNALPGAQRTAVLASCDQVYADAGAYAAESAATPVTWNTGGGSPIPFEGNQPATAALAAQRAAVAPAVTAPAATVAEGAPVLGQTLTLPTVGGFDLSLIPWWGWLAAGGVALFAFGGGRGR